MKPLSNTSISAIFAVGLTALVALMLQVPFFKDKETQTTDEMLLLRYQLHARYSPLKPDPHVVVAAIDQRSLDLIGHWPFSRAIHGDFLLLLAPEQPRAVGWDIMFTERAGDKVSQPSPAPQTTAPTDASPAPAAPPVTAPATEPPAPTADTSAAPPVAPNSAPPQEPTNAPASAATPPATSEPQAPTAPTSAPAAPSTNAAPSPAQPTPPSGARASNSIPNLFRIGADTNAAAANSAPATPAPTPENPTAPPSAAPSPAPAPAPANSTSPPPADTTLPPASPYLNDADQHFVDAASQFPNMVTGAELSGDIQLVAGGTGEKHDESDESDAALLPTRPFKHVTGDVTKLISFPHAVLPFPELRKETYFGFVNENGEGGGGSRRTDPLVVNLAGRILPNLDLQIIMQYWGIDPDQVTINLGHEITLPRPDGTIVHVPIDEQAQLTINYRARLEDFQRQSYAEMAAGLQDKAAGKESRERSHLPPLKDALVVIGVTFSGTDAGVTPLDNQAPLMVTHLNAINNILQQDYLSHVSGWVWMPLYALFLFGTGSLMLRVGIAPMIPMGLVALLLMAVVGFAVLCFGNLITPVAMPEIGILLLAGAVPTKRFFGEEREKLRVKKMMGAYLSDKIMAKLLAHPDGAKLGGVKQVITIMFCDIRGFTAYCDNRDPQEVLNVVNDYFEEMTKVVFKYEGTVDKYIGDCIMAFWNAPEDQPDHAQRAVCCAMEMRYALANFKVKRAGLDTELFECGIGIHTGEALVGNMGSSLKVNYTAMGSTVNLGARLESLTKKLNERILISQATLEQLTGDFPITDRGEALVPGFANPIHVYGVGAEQDLGSAIQVGLKLAKKQDYTAEEVTKPIWAPAPLPEDADPNP